MIVGGSIVSLFLLTAGSILMPDSSVMALASLTPLYIFIRLLCIILIITLIALKYGNAQAPIHLLAVVSVVMSLWAALSWYTYSIGILDLLAFLQVSVFLGLYSLGWYDPLSNSGDTKLANNPKPVKALKSGLRKQQDMLTTQIAKDKSATAKYTRKSTTIRAN